MKKLFYILILITGFANAQIVNIPDANFKARLIQLGVDTNSDGEIQESEALVVANLNVSNSNISDLTGIEFFTGLIDFNCSNNSISELNILNAINLSQLICSNTLITSLNLSGLNELSSLYSSNVPLSNLNITGLVNLVALEISNSQLTSLDLTTNSNLYFFEVSDNSVLTNIIASNLSALSSFFIISNPQLINVQLNGCNNLTDGYSMYDNENLSTLNLSGCSILTDFSPNNLFSLTNVDLSNCTLLSNVSVIDTTNTLNINLQGCISLTTLNLYGCNITNIDLSGLVNLQTVFLDENNFNQLDISGLNNLTVLSAWNSNLENLIFEENINLTTLLVPDNNIESLDLSTLENLNQLDCSNNPLTFLNIKNSSIESGLSLPNTIEYICVDEEQLEEVNSLVSNITVVNSYCSFTPGGNYNTISGNIKFDNDNNGCDVNDNSQAYTRVNIVGDNFNVSTFSNSIGNFKYFVQQGNYSISLGVENPLFFSINPISSSTNFLNNNNNLFTQDFCIQRILLAKDVEIIITPINPARPGFIAKYSIVIRNKGNQVVSGDYTMSFDDSRMNFISSTQVPLAQETNLLSWSYDNLQPFESRFIYVDMSINSPQDDVAVNNGDVLEFTVNIDQVTEDENEFDNTFTLNQTVVGSYDPNDITCLEGDIVSPTEIGGYLHYNIRFENTGTFYAENIVVKTEINPAEFDINTLQLLNASHAVDARIRGNIVEFIFKGIYLDTGGHGNVLLKVKTKPSLQTGDLVKNKANIYFDYNFPILTNDAETVFQSLTNPDFEIDNSIKIYPNPSNALVNIKSDFNIKSIQLYDVQGRILQTNIVEENSASLDITSKAKGIYFLKVITDKGIKVEKLVKE